MTTLDQVMSISFKQLSDYICTPVFSNYLFPYERIIVDLIPYQLKKFNIFYMTEMSSSHTVAFSDVYAEKEAVDIVEYCLLEHYSEDRKYLMCTALKFMDQMSQVPGSTWCHIFYL